MKDSTICFAGGLIVVNGVLLDLGGTTLSGHGAGAGVRIAAGAAHVTIRNGTVIGFGTGVLAEDTRGAYLSHLQALDSTGDGVNLTGDANTLDRSVIERNGRHGAVVIGGANRVANLRAEGNGGDGVSRMGTGNTATRNIATSNLGAGWQSGERAQWWIGTERSATARLGWRSTAAGTR